MAEWSADVAAEVLAACQQGAAEAAQALTRSLDRPIELAVGESATLDPEQLPDDLVGPGLIFSFVIGGSGALAILPESTGLLPTWYQAPDPTGQSKLATLAQELGMLLFPEAFPADDFRAGRVADIRPALSPAALATPAASVALLLTSGDQQGTLHLLWPAASPHQALAAAAPPAAAAAAAPTGATPAPPLAGATSLPEPSVPPFEELPAYTRSLLRISVPVSVTLAQKRQPIDSIVKLGPGSIIQFDKSCEEMLELEVGQQRIAHGEAVKVGEKFGLRITSITLPDERFSAAARRAS